ncbi:GGDEF domain-containing protein [Ancylobacter sp. 6x-1]|uniref:diguanylate cyclase n=1 Tax=Ancylobacter crimeensis TaxID=2579147 RepID=A0ABT0DFP5_9HYPH|nr:GGDEF domain-containing protein [Ancylobacter crimeensis]MCK0198772.1 GGDEF domain-containing protein [Ancylobacter crimeensis]
MTLDGSSLAFGGGVTALVFSLVFAWLWQNRRETYLAAWALGALCAAAGLTMASRKQGLALVDRSASLSFLVILLMAASLALLRFGIVLFERPAPSRITRGDILGAAGMAGVPVLAFIGVRAAGGAAYFAMAFGLVGLAFISASAAHLLLRSARRGIRNLPELVAGAGLCLYALALLVTALLRFYLGWAGGAEGVPMPVFFVVDQFVGAAIYCALIFMAAWRRRSELESIALVDPLTRLLNRRALGEAMGGLTGRTLGAVAVFMIDIDRFKAVNDTHGHDVGDEVLVELARRCGRLSHAAGATLYRYGGEEFLCLHTDTTIEAATQLAEALRHAIEATPFLLGPLSLDLTVSVGLAMGGAGDSEPSSIVKRADTALYAAKNAGRNRVSVAPSNAAGLPAPPTA